eukprot:14031350-Ditylum_brightwellii.AAC.1
MKLSKTSNTSNHLEKQIKDNLKLPNEQFIAVDKKIIDKISDLQTSDKQTKSSINKFFMMLSNLTSTIQMHQTFINGCKNEKHQELLLNDDKFNPIKEKLISEIKAQLKPDDLTSCNINYLSNKISAIKSITQDHNKLISGLQIDKHIDDTLINENIWN